MLDAQGRYVLPGLIDAHVHSGPPAAPRRSASGRVRVRPEWRHHDVLRYFRRPESYLETLPGQVALGAARHYQDFAHHLTLFNADQVAEMERYVRDFGVTSFKLYMNLKGPFGKGVLMDLLVGRARRADHGRRRLQRRAPVEHLPHRGCAARPGPHQRPFRGRRDRARRVGQACGSWASRACRPGARPGRARRKPSRSRPLPTCRGASEGAGLLSAHRLARSDRGARRRPRPRAPTTAPRSAPSTWRSRRRARSGRWPR